MINVQLARQVSACTRFRATTVAVHTLEKRPELWKEARGAQKKVESISNRTLTRAGRKDLTAETNMSAITDHVAKENHVIDRSGAKILDRESSTNKTTQGINLHRKEVNCMNRRGSLQPTNDL